MSQVAANLRHVLAKINEAAAKRPEELCYFIPRLVAVSKTKPVDAIIEAYAAGQRHFGENYVNELIEKASSQEILQNCPEIKWHFIGHLQSNKAKKIINVPNLYLVETVDSVKLADLMNEAWKNLSKPNLLNIMLQVNTSDEEQKGGIAKAQVLNVYNHVSTKCEYLKIAGLMTIGSLDASLNTDVELNADFMTLVNMKKEVCEKFNVNPQDLELSMGMSHDFEQAILMGSSNVRVGSMIFGSR